MLEKQDALVEYENPLIVKLICSHTGLVWACVITARSTRKLVKRLFFSHIKWLQRVNYIILVDVHKTVIIELAGWWHIFAFTWHNLLNRCYRILLSVQCLGFCPFGHKSDWNTNFSRNLIGLTFTNNSPINLVF